jgi:hypothetical protein
MMGSDVSRRRFVKILAALSTASTLQTGAAESAAQMSTAGATKRGDTVNTINRKNLVATQVKAYAWQDEGIEALLDNLQEKGNMNTVFAFTFNSEATDVSGKIPLPDHGTYGKANPEIGGAFYDYDPKYFADTKLKEFHAASRFNVISEVAPKMKARGMDFFAFDYNNTNANMMRLIPGLTETAEIDVYGKRTDGACLNHPDYRGLLTGWIKSYLSGYPDLVAGIIFGCERMGPLDNLIGGGWATTGICCFCPYCLDKARGRGISAEKAREGFIKLDRLFRAAGNAQRPADGYFVSFWRIRRFWRGTGCGTTVITRYARNFTGPRRPSLRKSRSGFIWFKTLRSARSTARQTTTRRSRTTRTLSRSRPITMLAAGGWQVSSKGSALRSLLIRRRGN